MSNRASKPDGPERAPAPRQTSRRYPYQEAQNEGQPPAGRDRGRGRDADDADNELGIGRVQETMGKPSREGHAERAARQRGGEAAKRTTERVANQAVNSASNEMRNRNSTPYRLQDDNNANGDLGFGRVQTTMGGPSGQGHAERAAGQHREEEAVKRAVDGDQVLFQDAGEDGTWRPINDIPPSHRPSAGSNPWGQAAHPPTQVFNNCYIQFGPNSSWMSQTVGPSMSNSTGHGHIPTGFFGHGPYWPTFDTQRENAAVSDWPPAATLEDFPDSFLLNNQSFNPPSRAAPPRGP